jgi:predicted Zn-dependent protease with MMP-like domain
MVASIGPARGRAALPSRTPLPWPDGNHASHGMEHLVARWNRPQTLLVNAIGQPEDGFVSLVFAAIDRLPEAFRERLGSVAIVVEDEPSPAQLAALRVPGLFGLYEGVPRTSWYADAAPVASKITIFRGPLLRAHRDPTELAAAVADTVHHEIAHHFGISDARLRELKQSAG